MLFATGSEHQLPLSSKASGGENKWVGPYPIVRTPAVQPENEATLGLIPSPFVQLEALHLIRLGLYFQVPSVAPCRKLEPLQMDL